MSLGQWLDDALTTAQQAAAAIERHGIPVPDLLAAFYARDRAWLSLARAADLIRGARRPHQRRLSAVTRELTDPTATPIRVLAAGAHAAVIRPLRSADVRLAATGPIAGLLIAAGDHLAVAADLLATHVTPRGEDERGLMLRTDVDPAVKALARNFHLTMVGAAIVGGIDRDEAVGELSRIAQVWMGIDNALDAGDNPAAAYLGGIEAEHLHRWVTSPFAGFLALHARAGPAVLLRQVEAATAADRSAGPRPIDSFDDVLRTVTDLSTAVKRDRRLVTARLLAELSRIGFAVEVLSSRIAGEDDPAAQTKQRAARWRDVAFAVTHVRDLRDDIAPEHADEAFAAADWLRDHVRSWTTPTPSTQAPYELAAMRHQLAAVATQAIEPWRQAVIDGDIMISVLDGLATQPRHGIKHAEPRWRSAGLLDPRSRDVMHRLADAAADTDPTWTHAANHQARRLRREEAAAANDMNNMPSVQARRQHLQLAVRANDIAGQARLVAAYLHAQIERLRSGDNDADWPPRTVEQKTLHEKVDALERELARQQQRHEIARATTEMHRVAAGLPAEHDPAQALNRLEADLAAARDCGIQDAASDEQPKTTASAPCESTDAAQHRGNTAPTAMEPPPEPEHRPPTASTATIGGRERTDNTNEL